MRVTILETENDSENATVLVAFNTLVLVCKNTQVCGMLVVRATAANATGLPHARIRMSKKLLLLASHFKALEEMA